MPALRDTLTVSEGALAGREATWRVSLAMLSLSCAVSLPAACIACCCVNSGQVLMTTGLENDCTLHPTAICHRPSAHVTLARLLTSISSAMQIPLPWPRVVLQTYLVVPLQVLDTVPDREEELAQALYVSQGPL